MKKQYYLLWARLNSLYGYFSGQNTCFLRDRKRNLSYKGAQLYSVGSIELFYSLIDNNCASSPYNGPCISLIARTDCPNLQAILPSKTSFHFCTRLNKCHLNERKMNFLFNDSSVWNEELLLMFLLKIHSVPHSRILTIPLGKEHNQ